MFVLLKVYECHPLGSRWVSSFHLSFRLTTIQDSLHYQLWAYVLSVSEHHGLVNHTIFELFV